MCTLRTSIQPQPCLNSWATFTPMHRSFEGIVLTPLVCREICHLHPSAGNLEMSSIEIHQGSISTIEKVKLFLSDFSERWVNVARLCRVNGANLAWYLGSDRLGILLFSKRIVSLVKVVISCFLFFVKNSFN